MPSFDIVSEVDKHELTNAVDQANREVANRFDFRGTDARVEQSDKVLTMHADSDFQLEQLADILRLKLVKRSIDISCLEIKDSIGNGKMRKQDVIVREGIDKDLSRKIVKLIKESKSKAYFAHPYSSWERGLNENTNGLLRQYFPKGSDFTKLTDEEVSMAMDKLNNRPKKCLGFKTPNQVFLGINPPVALAS